MEQANQAIKEFDNPGADMIAKALCEKRRLDEMSTIDSPKHRKWTDCARVSAPSPKYDAYRTFLDDFMGITHRIEKAVKAQSNALRKADGTDNTAKADALDGLLTVKLDTIQEKLEAYINAIQAKRKVNEAKKEEIELRRTQRRTTTYTEQERNALDNMAREEMESTIKLKGIKRIVDEIIDKVKDPNTNENSIKEIGGKNGLYDKLIQALDDAKEALNKAKI